MQDMVVANRMPIPTSMDKSETIALLNAEYIMSVTPGKEQHPVGLGLICLLTLILLLIFVLFLV